MASVQMSYGMESLSRKLEKSNSGNKDVAFYGLLDRYVYLAPKQAQAQMQLTYSKKGQKKLDQQTSQFRSLTPSHHGRIPLGPLFEQLSHNLPTRQLRNFVHEGNPAD